MRPPGVPGRRSRVKGSESPAEGGAGAADDERAAETAAGGARLVGDGRVHRRTVPPTLAERSSISSVSSSNMGYPFRSKTMTVATIANRGARHQMAFVAKERRSIHSPQARSGLWRRGRAYTPGRAGACSRILAVASAVDLDFRYGCTPAWWQLWKGLYEAGRRPHRDAIPRTAGRVAVVARRTQPDLPRGRDVRVAARRAGAA